MLNNHYAKFHVIKKIGTYSYQLDTSLGPHNVFHTLLLCPASTDPFLNQQNNDYQPLGELVEGELEYQVEEILEEHIKHYRCYNAGNYAPQRETGTG
jgi:hypothetical protein